MLRDIDWRYKLGKIFTSKEVQIENTVTVVGDITATGTITGGGGVLAAPAEPDNVILPGDYGLQAWNYDVRFAGTNQLLVNGTIYLHKFVLRKSKTINKVFWSQTTAGATATAGQNWIGLVNGTTGALITSVAADSKVTGAQTPQSVTFSGPQVLAAGTYFVAMLFNAATPPTVTRTSGLTQAANMVNQAAESYSHATNGTGATTLPSNFTLTSNALGPSVWVGLG